MTPQKKWLRDQSLLGRFRRFWWGARIEAGLTELLHQQTADLPLPEQLQWLEQLLHWTFGPGPEQVETRFRFLFQVLERNPDWQRNFERTWAAILEGASWMNFYTQIGLAVEHGLWGDIATRISDRLVPSDPGDDLQAIVSRVFTDPDRIDALAALSPETLGRLAGLLDAPSARTGWLRVRGQAGEARHALAAHVAHYGLGAQIRHGLPDPDHITGISFYRLTRLLADGELMEADLRACETDIARAYANLENSGVSVDAVNRLETLTALIDRIRRLQELVISPPDAYPAPARIRDYVVELASASLGGREVLGPLRRHFYLLSRKIVERNGQSAEHYIAHTGEERGALFRSAVIGGAIVVLMTVAKTWLIHRAPAPLFLATGIWIIYSAGFLGMQFGGGTLATKIPSFTASRLASLFKNVTRETRGEFRRELRATARSQALALVGNVVGLVPLVAVLDWVHRRTAGASYFDESYAGHILSDLHPLLSFVIPLGALTGVQLWLSSVAGGWFENWVVYRRLPESIRHHARFRRVFGQRSADRLAEWIARHASGLASNLSLGFLFGFVPLLGAVVGANWNGHHVTISSASAVFAMSTFGFEPGWNVAIWSIAGIFLIGLMNFGVSFGLALFIAASAQRVRFRRVLRYLRAAFRTRSS